jgi:Helix-turn-helix domain
MTKEQVSEVLQCKPSSVYEACRSRSQQRQLVPLPFFKIFNGQLRFRKSEIIKYLDALSQREAA